MLSAAFGCRGNADYILLLPRSQRRHRRRKTAHSSVGFRGSEDKRDRLTSRAEDALTKCWPLSLGAELARTIPGKVYFLQFQVDAQGRMQVLLRPFGSHVPADEEEVSHFRRR